MIRYFRVEGELETKFRQHFQKRFEINRAAQKLARPYKAELGVLTSIWGEAKFVFDFGKDKAGRPFVPDRTVWKKTEARSGTFYVPKAGAAEMKSLARQLKELQKQFPVSQNLAKLLDPKASFVEYPCVRKALTAPGLPVLIGVEMYTAFRDDRDAFEPLPAVAKYLVRTTDVEFERTEKQALAKQKKKK